MVALAFEAKGFELFQELLVGNVVAVETVLAQIHISVVVIVGVHAIFLGNGLVVLDETNAQDAILRIVHFNDENEALVGSQH